MSPWIRKSLLAVVVLIVLMISNHLVQQQQQATAIPFKSTVITESTFGQAWPGSAGVIDQNGKPRLLSDFKGKVVLLFFGYTQCPDVCPTALHRATQVFAQIGDQAKDVQVLFMTLDPQRDSTELLNQYIPAFDNRFLGLRPSPESVADIAKTFRVFYRINPGSKPDTYTLDHGVTTYAYNRAGQLRLAISHGASADDVATDVALLLKE